MSGVADGLREPGEFLVGWCPECGRDVLTYPDEAPTAGIELHRCIHCDERLGSGLRWISDAELAHLGYAVDADATEGGCATCASGGGCAVKSGNERRGIE